MERANYPIDLHCHTTRSDGADTPEELIENAALAGLKIIAMTDHDIRPPKMIGGKDAVEYAASKGVLLIPGIEVSCETTVEDCHIVCLGCDWKDPYFDELEQSVAESKINGYRKLADKLKESGYDITWEEILDNDGNPIKEEQIQKKMIFELLSRKGYFKTWSDAKLMVKNTPEFNNIAREKPDPLKVIEAVHNCGGITILAHPYLINEPVNLPGETLTREEYIRRLIKGGLNGIEAKYTYSKTSYSGGMAPEEIEQEVKEKYGKCVSIISGGSDYHADTKKGAKAPRNLGECGLKKEEFMENSTLSQLAAQKKRVLELKLKAAQCRLNVLRMVRAGGHGHVGGALSAIDVVTALYFDKMNISPENPKDPDRDRFLLSAGHKCLAQYAVLAEKGFFPKEVLDTYGDLGSHIPGHPDMHKLTGVEANTGALGHGLSIAAGMAMAAKLQKRDYKTYVICGDGELPEGSNWEAAAAAAKFGLDNLVAFVDNNTLQISGRVTDVMNMESIADKFRSFGWAVKEIDGNDMEEITGALDQLPLEEGKPNLILLHTVKAKGLSFGEDKAEYHFWNAVPELLEQAENEIAAQIEQLQQEVKAVTL